MLFTKENLPSEIASAESSPKDNFFVETNLRKKKWIFSCTCIPNREYVGNYLETLSKILVLYLSSYEKLIIVGDFIAFVQELITKGFVIYLISNVLKDAACYKNPENTNSIELILTTPQFLKFLCDRDRMVFTEW